MLTQSDENDSERLTLSKLRSQLECKSSEAGVEEFLQSLRILDEWRHSPAPSHHLRDAMLKIATQFRVKRKDRKPQDVAQDLEARFLSEGVAMLTRSVAQPALTCLIPKPPSLIGSVH